MPAPPDDGRRRTIYLRVAALDDTTAKKIRRIVNPKPPKATNLNRQTIPLKTKNTKTKKTMALIPAATQGGTGARIKETAPAGTHIATCVHVSDQFGVQRKTFDDPNKMETVDLATFYFGIKSKDGKMFLARSKEMKISGHPKSGLVIFLTGWLGKPPEVGWDYSNMKGEAAQVTIAHKTSAISGNTYAVMNSCTPCIEQVKAFAPPAADFEPLLADSGVEVDGIPF